jgi:beta-glucanase (GH16 family)
MVSCPSLFNVLSSHLVDYMEVYDTSVTTMNSYKGGPFQQAISGLSNLNNDWYDGKQYQHYAFEYKPGEDGFITWYVGTDKTWTMQAPATRGNGNIGRRTIPEEPMSIIANFGMSNSFAAIDLATINATLPATMRIDYIRIYQDEDSDTDDTMTCDPPGYPTTSYIRDNPKAYQNPNITHW